MTGMDPDAALDHLQGMRRAMEAYGDPPAPEFAVAILRHLAGQGLAAMFIPSLSDEGRMVWKLEIRTGRGTLAYHPPEGKSWREYLGSSPDGLDLLPPDAPRA